MASITDYKVKDEDFTDLDIASLPSRPSAAGMSATQLQERFDAGSKQVIKPKLNALIDLLSGSEGAANIGVTQIDGVAGYFLQEVLIALKLLLDDKKSIEQADREIGAKFDTTEARALVKEITFSESTGVFTITKYDGSVQTIDTAIEKVALDVRLDGQQFVLTLVDGTEQRVDLSAFLTQTEVTSSDTITLAIENGAIVARIASGSVKLAHLNAEVTAYIDAKELAAYQSAQAAAVSEQNALNSANAAEASRQAALACQEQACLCATQAELSRQAAATSEQAAKKAQEEAEKAAGEAKAIAGGDFLETSVYDPNGKETDVFKYVDDAMKEKFGEEDKLPVQNGGLYINSETTEEDKAEAQANLEGLGVIIYEKGVINKGDITSGNIEDILINNNSFVAIVFDTVAGMPYDSIWIVVNTRIPGLVSAKATNIYNGDTYMKTFVNSSWQEWKRVNSDYFIPLDGSVPMSGDLAIRNGIGYIRADNNVISIWSYNTIYDKDSRMFMVGNDNANSLQDALILRDYFADSTYKNYRIYGEHNTDLLATAIQSLIDSGVIQMGFRRPIKSQSFSLSKGESASGTGKGKIFVGTKSSSYPATVVIDGVSMSIASISYSPAVEFEFTKSWVVNGPNKDIEYVAGTAVFYE